MYKKILVIIIVILMIIFIIRFFSNPKSDDSNILVFSKDSVAGTKDLKLIGYFSSNLLERYELSYYVEYENEIFAKDDYDRLMDSIPTRNDIKYTYTIEKNCIYVKLDHIIKYMDSNTLKAIFETSNTSINKKQFENYAKKQGYTKQK